MFRRAFRNASTYLSCDVLNDVSVGDTAHRREGEYPLARNNQCLAVDLAIDVKDRCES